MGRSQETFGKKEKEQKKLKKRQNKEQKKEERKATASKGQNVEDMFVYVDDYGNLTSTPPDPRRKKEVKQEEIQIGVSRQEDIDPAELVRKGTVTFFNVTKGYGFIKDHASQESIFVHKNELQDTIKENDKVNFEVERGPKGLNALNVRLIS
ncbi:cold-shock protein [Telluribacter humicola]|uniref:cold-shock protein n=1 Tax=Telluribacter humicola TaxID=1720261 RepID=UPI001A95A378|nr:cold shock domain-containing protein [Telluribacter humicola]